MFIASFIPLFLMFFSVTLMTVFLVGLAQAHFIHCYIYQFRAGVIGTDFFVKLATGIVIALSACIYLGDDVLIPAAIIFIFHQFFDDLHLFKKQGVWSDYAQLSLVLIAFSLISVLDMNVMAQQVAIALMTVALIIGIVAGFRPVFFTLTLLFAIPLFYVFLDYQPGDWMIPLGIIIIAHYVRWMVYIYQTRRKNEKWVFLTEAMVLSVIFVLYASSTAFSVHGDYLSLLLKGLFSVQGFVVWTMAHIFSTIRPKWL